MSHMSNLAIEYMNRKNNCIHADKDGLCCLYKKDCIGCNEYKEVKNNV